MSESTRRDIVVVGASSGGIEAFKRLVQQLPADLPASIFFVQHLHERSPNLLPEVFARAGRWPVKTPEDGEVFERGRIYVAPANYHMLIDARRVWLSTGPRENRARPAIDPLFRSAAAACGPRVVGIVLSGLLDDGSAGLWAVKRAGGVAIAQALDDADFPDMPRNAIRAATPQHVATVDDVVPLLQELVGATVGAAPPPPDGLDVEVQVQRAGAGRIEQARELGEPVSLSCPECGGPLWGVGDDPVPRFRCHTGHAFTGLHLADGLSESTENALWVALRTLDERARMLEKLAENMSRKGAEMSAQRFQEDSATAREQADAIRSLLGRVPSDE